MYNDNKWHTVEFSRNGPEGKLVIDGEHVDGGRTIGNTVKVELNIPFYLGGINPDHENEVLRSLVSGAI